MDDARQSRAEKSAGALLVAFGVFVAWYSRHYLKLGTMITPGAGFLPFWIGIALTVLGVAWLAKVLLHRPAPPDSTEGGGQADGGGAARDALLDRLLPGILLVAVYAWLFERAGYLLSTALFMAGWQKLVERERWPKSAVLAAISAACMYVLFARLLKVFLPSGTWWG